MSATHVYNGPKTLWGLEPGTRVRIVGHRGGTLVRREADDRQFLVIRGSLEPITEAPKHGRWRRRAR